MWLGLGVFAPCVVSLGPVSIVEVPWREEPYQPKSRAWMGRADFFKAKGRVVWLTICHFGFSTSC